MSDPFLRLQHELQRLPGVGRKSAERLAYFIVGERHGYAAALAQALGDAASAMRRCSLCGHLSSSDPCRFCSDDRRANGQLCVVERVPDLLAIEASGAYGGRYHVLGGSLAPLDGRGPEELNLAGLGARVSGEGVAEVIMATNPTVDGEATALYIERLLRPSGVRITRLASGLPAGGDLEYMDRETIVRALSYRRELSA